MDAIDREAHEAIQKIIDSKGGWFGPWAMLSLIWTILVAARTAAEAVSAAAVGTIATQAARIQSATEPSPGGNAHPPMQPRRTVTDSAGRCLHGGQREDSATDVLYRTRSTGACDANKPPQKVQPNDPPAPSPNAPIRDAIRRRCRRIEGSRWGTPSKRRASGAHGREQLTRGRLLPPPFNRHNQALRCCRR